jgi:predicted membrane metal-binding protein
VKIALVAIGLSVILLADYHIREQVVDSDVANWSESRLVVVKAIVEDVGGDADSSKRRLSLKALELLYPKQERLCGSLIAFEHGTSPALSKGDLIEIGLKPRMTRQCRYPFQFDYASYLRQRRISMNAFVVKDSVKVLTLAKDRQRSIFEAVFEQFVLTVDCLRERLVSLHRKSLGDEQGLLLSSMVLGNRNVDLPEELNKNFRITGLSHILAASGFNLSIVAFISYGLACFICRRIGLMSSSAYAYGFCFLAMCVFVIFAGPSPSVLRAFLMCSLVLIAKASFKTIRLGDSLALALLLCLAIEPLWVNDISLQFSWYYLWCRFV